MNKLRQTIKGLLDEANAALLQGQYPLAVTIAEAILTQKPDYPQGYSIKFKGLVLGKEYAQAREIGLRAAALNPTSEYILNNQACLELEAGHPARAIRLLNSLLKQHGDQASWLYNLGLAHRQNGQTVSAIEAFKRVLDLKPDHDKAAFQLVECLVENGQLDEAAVKQNYLRMLRASHASSHSQFINLSVKAGQFTRTQLKLEARLWKKRFIPKAPTPVFQTGKGSKSMTIGFLIGDLTPSWIEHIVAPVVNALAENGDKILIYSHNATPLSNSFLPIVTQLPSAALTEDQFVAKVRADKTDVLVDICGFNQGERQSALGLQLASKQFGWLAHPGYYASSLVRVMDKDLSSLPLFVKAPTTSLDSPTEPLARNTLAAIGCSKGLSNTVVRTWAEVLLRERSINLHLDTAKQSVIETLSRRFENLGVNESRLSFAGNHQFNHDTVVVDNFMQNDIVAVAKAANSGACVVALDGELFPGKRSAQLLRQLDRPEWVSIDRVSYVAKIIQQLNEQVKNPLTSAQIIDSGLYDLDSFVQQFRKILLS